MKIDKLNERAEALNIAESLCYIYMQLGRSNLDLERNLKIARDGVGIIDRRLDRNLYDNVVHNQNKIMYLKQDHPCSIELEAKYYESLSIYHVWSAVQEAANKNLKSVIDHAGKAIRFYHMSGEIRMGELLINARVHGGDREYDFLNKYINLGIIK